MDKHAVVRVLDQIAAFLELKGESPFRVRAYRTAGKTVAQYSGDLSRGIADGALTGVKGLGAATVDIIRELVTTGRSNMLDELREQVPPGLVEMLQISGLGVAKVRQIHRALGVESLGELEAAARDGRLAGLPRFGPRTAENVLKGIAFLREASEYRLLHHARDEAEALRRGLAQVTDVTRVEIAGAVRRGLEVIRHLEFVIEHRGPRDIILKRLAAAPGVTEIATRDAPRATLRFAGGTVAEVSLTDPEGFGTAWVMATGSDEHVAQLRALAAEANGAIGPAPSEQHVYRLLQLPWIPPELREGKGEIEAARAGRLPRLLVRDDLQGFLHCHSRYSDGANTVAEWAEACRGAGYRWMGITDHSGAAAYAGGLTIEDIPRQHAEVDEINTRFSDFRVLKGVEADILADGTLDYGPALDRFDFVIGSIHSRFGMTREEMTARVLKAMDDPRLTILGHPTGRLLLAREPFAIDLEPVFRKAADRGIAVEVNADPHRLDLDWRQVREALRLDVAISIGADAHSTAGLTNVDAGVVVARKGWVEPHAVLNARSVEAFLEYAWRRRG